MNHGNARHERRRRPASPPRLAAYGCASRGTGFTSASAASCRQWPHPRRRQHAPPAPLLPLSGRSWIGRRDRDHHHRHGRFVPPIPVLRSAAACSNNAAAAFCRGRLWWGCPNRPPTAPWPELFSRPCGSGGVDTHHQRRDLLRPPRLLNGAAAPARSTAAVATSAQRYLGWRRRRARAVASPLSTAGSPTRGRGGDARHLRRRRPSPPMNASATHKKSTAVAACRTFST